MIRDALAHHIAHGVIAVVANEGQRIDIPDGCVLENREFIHSYTM